MSTTETEPSYRERVEHALVAVSHRLVESSEVDLREVLGAICGAVGAESGYIHTFAWGVDETPPDIPWRPDMGALVYWHVDGRAPPPSLQLPDVAQRRPHDGQDGSREDRGAPGGRAPEVPGPDAQADHIVIPILSKHDHMIGSVGIKHPGQDAPSLGELGEVLTVFGDLLASYLTRVMAEQALGESEGRWRELVSRHPDAIVIVRNDQIVYANYAAAELLGVTHPYELLEYRIEDFISAEQQPVVERLRAQQAGVGPRAPLEHEVIRLDGDLRIVESIAATIQFRGREALQIVLRDVTARRASEERFATFVQTISEGIWRIDLRPRLSTLLDPAAQVQHLLEHGHLAETNSMMRQMLGPETVDRLAEGPVGEVFFPRILFEHFVRHGYRLDGFEFVRRGQGPSARHFSVNAVGSFQRDHLTSIWGSCSDVSDRAEMERQMVAALEEQQERIGRDLHDGLGQLLTGVRMLSDNLVDRLAAAADGALLDAGRKISAYAREAADRVRETCRGLAPPQLFQERLAYSLRTLVSSANGVSATLCTFDWDGSADVGDGNVKLQLFRIAQEAINNALKHAAADRIVVRLRTSGEGGVQMEISDNGRGFDATQHRATSLGIYSMQRRANSIDADLEIDSAEGGGTRVRVLLAPAPIEDSPHPGREAVGP